MTPLIGDYSYREMEAAEFGPMFFRLRPKVFGDTLSFDVQGVLSSAEKEAVGELSKPYGKVFALNLGIYHKDECIGWHVSVQQSQFKLYMMSTGILPAHQQQGIYTALLPVVLEHAKDAGFQIVYSRHHPTNNAIIVPKLKAGFVITNLELTDNHGLLVHLSYYSNPVRRKALDFRVGQAVPDEELRKYLNL